MEPMKQSVIEGSNYANEKIESNPKLKSAKETTKSGWKRASTYMWSWVGNYNQASAEDADQE